METETLAPSMTIEPDLGVGKYFLHNYSSFETTTSAIPASYYLVGPNFDGGSGFLQWLRTRTYVSSMPTFTIGSAVSYYSVSFHESGLPSLTEWWVNVTGQSSVSSTSTYANLTNPLPNGTYYYNISTINKKYFPTPKSGSIVIDGANVSVSIVFSNYFITLKPVETAVLVRVLVPRMR